jgi:hypothetical protein
MKNRVERSRGMKVLITESIAKIKTADPLRYEAVRRNKK